MVHVVTFEKSEIRTLADLKGEKAYTGPARYAIRSTGIFDQIEIACMIGY